MQLDDFKYELPPELIAYHPTEHRPNSKLLCYNRPNRQVSHANFSQITSLLHPNDLLVLNQSKVIKARLLGHKSSGGKVELLIAEILAPNMALAYAKSSKPIKVGTQINIADQVVISVMEKTADNLIKITTTGITVTAMLELYGLVPLPPYIKRQATASDIERYQNVYATTPGSIAAPTAGLHFDNALLHELKKANINIATITLHVGAGTFQPIRSNNILEHKMHAEYCDITQATCDLIAKTKANGNRVIAVGTTVVRALETAALKNGSFMPYSGPTDLFIYPGFSFNVIDALITNFHLSGSTLLLLVSAFVGRDTLMQLYQTAIAQRYRFYSYGDAMFIS